MLKVSFAIEKHHYRAACQRIPHRVWTDEEGVEHVEVNLTTFTEIYLSMRTHFIRTILNFDKSLG